jgi:DNA-binding NarL/FixJ family response regulator/tRNA A-37 threonylcarbamoyl transferase component Bud32
MTDAGGATTILLVEDQELTRIGLKMALDRMPGLRVVGEAADGLAAVTKALELKPAVIVMDIGLPGIDGVEATHRIKTLLPHTRVVMVTTHDTDEAIFAALNAGADGYCLKNVSVQQLALAIETVKGGAAWLDPGIAGRVLKASATSASQSGSKKGPEADRLAFSKNEKEILSLVEQGLRNEQIASRLMIDVENVRNYMCQILERLVVSRQISVEPLKSGDKVAPDKSKCGEDVDLLSEQIPALTAGTILADRYVVEGVLGTGGMSRVYRAKHLLMDKPVAIKVLHHHLMGDKVALTRFQQEAKTVSVLNHPNIVRVFDFGLSEFGQPFLVMDYIQGEDLESVILENNALDPDRAVRIFSKVLEGLSAAHAKRVIHRDLKPSNIMLVNTDDEPDFAMIIDFGIAKILLGDEAVSSKLTPTGEVYGSLAYMSPEQCKSVAVDHRTDIYSLGCVMYQALTGKIAFQGSGPYEVISKHLKELPAPFGRVCPDKHVPANLEAVVFKALAIEPGQRFQSAAEMKKSLTAVLTR